MSKSLHLVYGGELVDPAGLEFRDTNDVHLVGIFASYEDARNAWKSEAQRTVDNAHMRYFIAELNKPSADTADEDGNA